MMEKKSITNSNERPFDSIKNRLFWACGCLACASLFFIIVFWFTNLFNDMVLSGLELRNGTTTFSWWQRPPVRLLYKVRIFNYTNVEEFESGRATKLRVEEVGPYNYRETLTRVNVVFHEKNGTVTYQENRSFQWEGGSPDDELIVVPNVPLFSTVAYSRDKIPLLQFGVVAFLTTMPHKVFINLPVGGYLWGYDDDIFRIGSRFQNPQQRVPIDKFGLMAIKTGLNRDRITIHTGRYGFDNLGMIQRVNGEETRGTWEDEVCDKINGTDGSVFPPHIIQNTKEPLQIHLKDMCRNLPLHFHGYTMARGISCLRYKIPVDMFSYSNGTNTCFCQKTPSFDGESPELNCPPKGIFNSSSCNYKSSLLASFPHFYGGDESLFDHIEGLNPQGKLHESFVDIHPRLAVPIQGWSRFQLNLQVKTAEGVPFLGKVKDGTILPLIWVEAGIDNIPEHIMTLLNHAYFTAGIIETGLQWGGLAMGTVSIVILLHLLNKYRVERHLVLKRNLSGQNKLLEQS